MRAIAALGLLLAACAGSTSGEVPAIEGNFDTFVSDVQPVLRGCSLEIVHGDRLLLEGSSGAGKSTLAAVLTGLRAPMSGLLMLHGLDRQTLGSLAWRRRIVGVPQFHENHVLAETFALRELREAQATFLEKRHVGNIAILPG